MVTRVHIETEAFDVTDLQVLRLDGREAIGQLFDFELEVVVPEASALDCAKLHGAAVAIVFETEGAKEASRIWGMLWRVVDRLSHSNSGRIYRFFIRPRAHRLGLVHMQDIFLGETVPDILKTKLSRLGLGEHVKMQLTGSYDSREFVLQYNESDLAFVSRHAEHLGMSMIFTHDDTADTVVFVDYADGFPTCEGPPLGNASAADAGGFRELEITYTATPSSYVVQDYNYRTPTLDITGEAEVTDGYGGGVVEYAAHYKSSAEAKQFAQMRADGLHADQVRYRGKSERHDIRAGMRFKVEDYALVGDVELLAVEVHHRMSVAGDGGESGYHNVIVATVADRSFRPPRTTKRPHMPGIYVALVQPNDDELVGPSAKLDDEGRYRVRFLFDSQPRDSITSHPIRMSQPHSGAGHGMHFPLRPGVEVAIAFANGDPDRPIILGALDNPSTRSPTTAGNHKENLITTASGIRITMRDAD